MSSKPVCLIAFEEQDNLGVGYLASVILDAGFNARIIDFRLDKHQILEKVRSYDPLIVGFSIIFQYHIDEFKNLIDYLREQEICCHFSAGGHYPSLNCDELLQYVPQLDSVVLYEGEHTFLELVKAIYSCSDWRKIKGIAYRENGSTVVNPLRQLEKDLDVFPLPIRQPLKEFALGKRYATILAGRGCLYHCSFCSIREFYSKPGGSVKRVRRPELVVREMELLLKDRDCSLFMFQDDDFPVTQDKGQWIAEFCTLLVKKKLSKKIMWKINCRPDEVDYDKFELMEKCGLFLVYLGIESGTNDGLALMNKRIKVETSIEAVEILKRLGINYDYGFMLFDPSTTYQSILENLAFLETICGDGSSPITFCKMLPYAGTKIESELRNVGRLKGTVGSYDYDFLDPSMNNLYTFMIECFRDWIMRRDGLLNASRWSRYYLAVYEKYFARDHLYEDLYKTIRKIISQSNRFFVSTTRTIVSIFSSERDEIEKGLLDNIKAEVTEKESEYYQELAKVFDKFPRVNTAKSE